MQKSARFYLIFSNQQGQTAAIFLAIFAFLLVFFLIPRKFVRSTPPENPTAEGIQYCQDMINDPNAPIVTAPSYSTTAVDSGTIREYRLIKKAVLIDHSLYANRVGHHFFEDYEEQYTDSEGKRYIKKIPNGEQGKSYKLPSGVGGENQMIFSEYGLLYLFYADNQFNLLETGSLNIDGSNIVLATVDIYKAVDLPPLPEWVLACIDAGTNGVTHNVVFKAGSVVIPEQEKSDSNEQLQLEWFLFDNKTVLLQAWWTPHCKPAVYLYPPQKMQVNVKVHPAGTLIYTDPQYDLKKGWTVDAYPDGTITTSYELEPANYPYLYFESKVPDEVIHKPTKGWVVKTAELNQLYLDILPKLGLNPKQTADFAEYWNKALPESPYYFVGVIDQKNVDQIERLEITPKPDYINRVRIYFERLDQPKNVVAPELSAESGWPKADGRFVVVEWGGMVKNDPNHPFTCSQ